MTEVTTQEAAAPVAIDQEVPFTFDELFFSRTNPRGIIVSGNSVFQRISLYDWEDLIDKPHNVIRHPDMPRGVFWLLWDSIKRGQPIGAYVKNRAKDGRHYWVYAIVTPVDGGYLSVRLKPSAVLPVVEREYKALLAAEKANALHARDSAALLLKRLAELGFDSYDAFMAATLSQEMAARDSQLNIAPDRALAQFDELVSAAKTLLAQSATIFTAYDNNKFVPMNLSIQASQLGKAGATIGVISDNYNIISAEIKETLGTFMKQADEVLASIVSGQFRFCTAKVQEEVAEYFRKEQSGESAQNADMALLEGQRDAYRALAANGLRTIIEQAERFQQDCGAMKQLATGLEVTRVMAKMECARLPSASAELGALIDELKAFQTTIAECLSKIDGFTQDILNHAGHLKAGMDRAAGKAANKLARTQVAARRADPDAASLALALAAAA